MAKHEAVSAALNTPVDDLVKRDPAPKVERAIRQLESTRFKNAEFVRNIHYVFPFPDTEPEDLLRPEYLAHVATQVKLYDRVEALADNGSWWAEYLVIGCGRAYVQLAMLRKVDVNVVDMNSKHAEALREYDVVHRGPHSQWSVVRRSDSNVVHEGEQQKSGADNWLTNHLKALGR